ncbi:MAG: hypothetical protein U0822_04335 [Anaerolineae bacterium]
MSRHGEDKGEQTERSASDKRDEGGASDKALPPADSVVAEETFTSPSGRQYRIIHTDETDGGDKPQPKKSKRRKTKSGGGDAPDK